MKVVKPYFEQDGISIYYGDCREVLPTLAVCDLLLTDPPYGIGLDMVLKHGTSQKSIHEDADWNDQIPSPECFALMHEKSREQIIWGCNYFASRVHIPAVGRIVHDKQLCIEGTALRWSEADIASCSLQKRITIFRYRWNGNVQGDTINWNNTGDDRRVHPTQKPISLMNYCIERYSEPGDLILDPYVGSGTTLVAAKRAGRRAIGIEISERYCEVAANRLAQGVLFGVTG